MAGTRSAHVTESTPPDGLFPNKTISVLNRARLHTTDGPETIFPGWAEITDAKKPGEITVHLVGVPVAAPYWVFLLGPQTFGPDGLYEYAVVSSPLQVSLFVLARNVTTYYSTWKSEIDGYLAKNGWDKVCVPSGGGGICSDESAPTSATNASLCTFPASSEAVEQAHRYHADWVYVLVMRLEALP
jgi:lipocalin